MRNKKLIDTQKQLELFTIISKISASFVSVRKEDADQAINESLRLIMEFVNADRAYIFRYDIDKNTCSNTYERCSLGITPAIDTLQDVPLNDIQDWVNTHKQNKPLYIPELSKLPINEGIRRLLEPQGIKSLLTIPLFKYNKLYGFLGFDSVKQVRTYSEWELKVLVEFSSVLISFIKRIDLEKQIDLNKIRFEYIADASNIGAWEWNIQTGQTVVNAKWAKMIGYTLSELGEITIETWEKYTNPSDLVYTKEILKKVLSKEIEEYRAEFRMIHKDGSEVWIRDSGKVILWEKDEPLIMIGSHIDITELKKKQEALQVITHAVDSSPAGVIITDSLGNIKYVNPRFTKITGFEPEEVLGKNPRLFKSNLYDQKFYETMWKHLISGKEWTCEFLNTKKNREKYWESASISPVINERGEIINYVAIKVDITEKKKLEMLENEKKKKLEEELQIKLSDLEESQKAAVFALARLTESRDVNTGNHVDRVQYLCKTLSTKLKGFSKYSDIINSSFIDEIFYASALHDIGKIKIPDSILLKKGKLTSEEFEIMKSHVKIGADTLFDMVRLFPNNKIIVMAAKIARYHHEKWNGEGYLEGLSGEDIPLSARIMALVDVYDALRSTRPYKEAMDHTVAMEIIGKGSGTHFDPDVVKAFVEANEEFEIIYDSLNK